MIKNWLEGYPFFTGLQVIPIKFYHLVQAGADIKPFITTFWAAEKLDLILFLGTRIKEDKKEVMKFEKIHNKGQAQIFRNKYLEYFTKTHPLVIWGMYIPVIIYLLYYSNTTVHFSVLKITLLFFGGIFFWTFFEYIMHRFVFHWVSDNPRIQRLAYVMHGNHHEFPRDKQRLFMPPVPSLIISSIVFLLMYALIGYNAMPFFPGFILGYLLYGSMHYAIHAWNPKQKWLKPIWRNHHLHHYKSEDKGFGVSSHLWDWVFGTQFDLNKEKENKAEVAKLMHER